MKLIQCLVIVLIVISSTSCDPTNRISKPNTDIEIEKPELYSTSHWIDTSAVFSKSFTGFALYDPDFNAFIDSVNYDKYFTPASNTKLYTCYAAMKTLKKEIGGLRYVINGDSLIFWGMGDPSMLNSDFDKDPSIINFLKDRKDMTKVFCRDAITITRTRETKTPQRKTYVYIYMYIYIYISISIHAKKPSRVA